MPSEIKKTKAKPKAIAVSTKHQQFDGEQARSDAMAMFSGDRNNYKRGADNKWKKAKRP